VGQADNLSCSSQQKQHNSGNLNDGSAGLKQNTNLSSGNKNNSSGADTSLNKRKPSRQSNQGFQVSNDD
jgi:hypothetical protein